jgi:hypothetical protein
MSSTSQGPGWWLASDGKWYPPELWTGPRAQGPASGGAVYGGGVPPGSAGYGAGTPYGQIPLKKTNGLAVAALVCGCTGFLFFIPGILAVIFGFIARKQITRANGLQKGDGMAIAGIILGFAWMALLVATIALDATHHTNGSTGVANPAILLGQLGPDHLLT